MNPAGPRAARRRGVTLMELLVALALAGMILAISFPSLTRGLDGIRLQTSARRLAAFINDVRARAERAQQPVEIVIEPQNNRLSALSAGGDWDRELALEAGVRISAVLPVPPGNALPEDPRRFVLLPGVPGPRFQVQLTGRHGELLAVGVDPLSGVPEILEAPP
jgi:prepilin-type N-terminal cleavage/methylation domain-containing protein